MSRSIEALDRIPVTQWTDAEAALHLEWSFDAAVKQYPDIMERYLPRIDDLTGPERVHAMRLALRETVKARYPETPQRSVT